MNIISHQMIFELNEILKEYNLCLKLADACGNQVVSILTIGSYLLEGEVSKAAYENIEKYFSSKYMKVELNPLRSAFTVK